MMNRIQLEDYHKIGMISFIDWELFRDAIVLVTGSTGLIGSNLVNCLAYNSKEKQLNIKMILPVRNIVDAERMFGWTGAEIIPYEIDSKDISRFHLDYIVHLASPTSSVFFRERPVDTIWANVKGYKTFLELAKECTIKKFIGLSTMEVYGFPQKGHKVNENELGAFETMNSRNSYPIAKILCEALCNSYYTQFGVPTVILRATQTFGPGVKYNDNRVFAQFMRCALEKKDIVLKSAGLTERSYLYTADAVSAILVGMQKARPGQAYTIANPKTYCSIKDMAQMVAKEIAGGDIKVVFDISEDIEKLGYAGTLYMDLSIDKIGDLGWAPTTDLKTMFERMIRGLQSDGK